MAIWGRRSGVNGMPQSTQGNTTMAVRIAEHEYATLGGTQYTVVLLRDVMTAAGFPADARWNATHANKESSVAGQIVVYASKPWAPKPKATGNKARGLTDYMAGFSEDQRDSVQAWANAVLAGDATLAGAEVAFGPDGWAYFGAAIRAVLDTLRTAPPAPPKAAPLPEQKVTTPKPPKARTTAA